MKPFRKPDLNAPRYRPRIHKILRRSFYEAFRTANPQFVYISDAEIQQILETVHGLMWQEAIDNRDGIELPEYLGAIFISCCPRKKRSNTDYKRSAELGFVVQHRNWESDEHVAKINYTNYESRYKFKFHQLWGFDDVRQFGRTVAKTFPERYNYYVKMDGTRKNSRVLRQDNYKQRKQQVDN